MTHLNNAGRDVCAPVYGDNALFYTGIGARNTPPEALKKIEELACLLSTRGWILRSGGAEGADTAFERGADLAASAQNGQRNKEIYIPWNGFRGRRAGEEGVVVASSLANIKQAMTMAEKYHPAWLLLKNSIKLLHSRNAYQLLGGKLDKPSRFVVCWTEKGAIVGGTGQALRMAMGLAIPIINLGDPQWKSFCAQEIVKMVEHLIGEGKPQERLHSEEGGASLAKTKPSISPSKQEIMGQF